MRPLDGGQSPPGPLVDGRQRRPRRGDLDGVGHDAAPHQRLERRQRRCGARASAPTSARRGGWRPPRLHSSPTTDSTASISAGSPSSSTIRSAPPSISNDRPRLGRVVEPEHGRRGAPLQDAPAGVQPAGEVREADTPPAAPRPGRGWARRRASVMTPRVPSLPTNSWVRSGPIAGPRRLSTGADQPAVGQGHLQAGRPCPRSSRSGSSTGRLPGRPASRRRSTAAIDCGQWPSVRSWSACSVSSRASPKVPARTSTRQRRVVDVDDPVQPGACRARPHRTPARLRRTPRCGPPPR